MVLGKLNDTVDRLNSLANSPAGQTAIRAYTGGVGLPTGVPSIGAGNSSGVDMAALQEALKAAGCPFAKNATPGEFNRTVNALGIFDAVGLLNIFGGREMKRLIVLMALVIMLTGCGVIFRKDFTEGFETGASPNPSLVEKALGVYYNTPTYGNENGPKWKGKPWEGYQPPYGRHGLVGLFGIKTGEGGPK